MARYSDIRRGAQLQAALTAYTTYLTTARTPNLSTTNDRPVQIGAGVIPFGTDIAGDMVSVNCPQTGATRLKTLIDGVDGAKVFTAAEVTGDIEDIIGFKPARITTFENATKTKTIETSEVTGQRYLKYAGERFSAPFGRETKAGTDRMIPVFNALKAALLARTGLAVNRVSLSPEKFDF